LSLKLQNHSFNIGILKTEMKICFKNLFKLVGNPDAYEKSFEELIKINWELYKLRFSFSCSWRVSFKVENSCSLRF